MSKETDNIVLRHLYEIGATLSDHSRQLKAPGRIENQVMDLQRTVTFWQKRIGETKFVQSCHKSQLDELLRQFEMLPKCERSRLLKEADTFLRANELGEES